MYALFRSKVTVDTATDRHEGGGARHTKATLSGFVRAHWSVLEATRKTIGGHHSAPAYVVPPPCRKGAESVVFELLFFWVAKRHTRSHREKIVRCYIPRLGCHEQMTPVRATTARGWPGTRGHARARARVHAHANADGHVARPPRKKRAHWCGHAALPDRCQRRPAAVNVSASASASVPVGVRVGKFVVVVVGREGTDERVRASASASWSVVRLRLAWTLMLIGVEATRRARRLRACWGITISFR